MLAELPWQNRREASRHWLSIRWMDDAVRVTDEKSSGPLKAAVRRLTRKRAYGRGLSLVRTEGREAFGFHWRIREGRVEVEQELKWISDFKKLWGLRRPEIFCKAGQMDTDKRQRGVLLGYILRIADCTNVRASVIKMRLRRLTLEMVCHGHKKRVAQSVLREAGEQLLCETREIEECLEWSDTEQQTYRLCHDAAYRLEDIW